MCTMITTQGVAFATAMAVSGTVILLALRLQKSFPQNQFSPSPPSILRSCISSDGKKREEKKKKKKKKKVHFAEDVMDSCKDGEEFRRQHQHQHQRHSLKSMVQKKCNGEKEIRDKRMPANRVALYNGILRDRVSQRLAYSC